jgi:hypothetical protein
MIAQRCRAPLSVHNVMNLCCPTIFAPNVAVTGERQSSKKKKNRMIALREKARMPRPEDLGWTAKMAFSLEEAPWGARGSSLKPGKRVRGKAVWLALARVEGGNVFFLKRRCGYCVGAFGGWGSNA